jgi:hypothetical protein
VAVVILSGCRMAPAATVNDGPEPVVSEAASRAVIDRVAAEVAVVKRGDDFTVTATQDEVSSFLAYGHENLGYYQDAFDAGQTPEARQIPGMEQYVTDAQWTALMQQFNDSTNRAAVLLRELRDNLQDPRVYFTAEGQIVVRGFASVAGARTPVRVVLVPEERTNDVRLSFVEAQLGGLQAPDWVSNMIEEALDRAIRVGEQDVRITEVVIVEGQATISGTVRE